MEEIEKVWLPKESVFVGRDGSIWQDGCLLVHQLHQGRVVVTLKKESYKVKRFVTALVSAAYLGGKNIGGFMDGDRMNCAADNLIIGGWDRRPDLTLKKKTEPNLPPRFAVIEGMTKAFDDMKMKYEKRIAELEKENEKLRRYLGPEIK